MLSLATTLTRTLIRAGTTLLSAPRLKVFDTPGGQSRELAEQRRWVYRSAKAVVLVFSLTDPASPAAVADFWGAEIARCCPNTPVVLVGTHAGPRDARAPACHVREERRVDQGDGPCSSDESLDYHGNDEAPAARAAKVAATAAAAAATARRSGSAGSAARH